MILGIDASNLRGGGGVTHLINFLKFSKPEMFNIKSVIVWGGRNPLEKLPQYDWLNLREIKQLNRSPAQRIMWHNIWFDQLVKESGCGILYIPGGLYLGKFRPYVALCQTLLPFNNNELNRYGISKRTLRLTLLRLGQTMTFKRSNGNIFLTKHAKQFVTDKISPLKQIPSEIIPHGVDQAFVNNNQKLYKNNKVTKILYVSTIDFYKHQWQVVSAVSLLRKEGFAVELSMVGSSYSKALEKLNAIIKTEDPNGDFIKYKGTMDYLDLPSIYKDADIFVFASSCENLPITLLEAMASHLPIACSKISPMPEILKDAGIYFDPYSVSSIKESIKHLMQKPDSRNKFSEKAGFYSTKYSWKNCADKTFSFINDIFLQNSK